MYSNNKSEKVAAPPLASKRLLDQVRERIRYLHYSLKTEKAYSYWVRFLYFGAQNKAACGSYMPVTKWLQYAGR